MTPRIRIDISHGSHFVSREDRERALDAAIDALGSTSPADAYAEYAHQIDENLGDTSKLTGLAEVWDRVQSSANIALTEGWHDTDGAFCEVIAE